jgi:hypothetical protein
MEQLQILAQALNQITISKFSLPILVEHAVESTQQSKCLYTYRFQILLKIIFTSYKKMFTLLYFVNYDDYQK